MSSALGITGWKIGWKISRFGAYLPAFILLMHSEMCRCWNICHQLVFIQSSVENPNCNNSPKRF